MCGPLSLASKLHPANEALGEYEAAGYQRIRRAAEGGRGERREVSMNESMRDTFAAIERQIADVVGKLSIEAADAVWEAEQAMEVIASDLAKLSLPELMEYIIRLRAAALDARLRREGFQLNAEEASNVADERK
jgi:hypothetical protein